MSVAMATGLWGLLGGYFAAGVCFAVAFHLRGAARIDPDAAHPSWGFRVLVTPGVVALWPLLARRWASGQGAPPEPRDVHRDAAR